MRADYVVFSKKRIAVGQTGRIRASFGPDGTEFRCSEPKYMPNCGNGKLLLLYIVFLHSARHKCIPPHDSH